MSLMTCKMVPKTRTSHKIENDAFDRTSRKSIRCLCQITEGFQEKRLRSHLFYKAKHSLQKYIGSNTSALFDFTRIGLTNEIEGIQKQLISVNFLQPLTLLVKYRCYSHPGPPFRAVYDPLSGRRNTVRHQWIFTPFTVVKYKNMTPNYCGHESFVFGALFLHFTAVNGVKVPFCRTVFLRPLNKSLRTKQEPYRSTWVILKYEKT